MVNLTTYQTFFRMYYPEGFSSCRRSVSRGPYNQVGCSHGPTLRQASSKTYVIDVPVYAAPTGTAQEEWNKLTHKFTITDSQGKAKTYEVSQNMANPKSAEAKIYPPTGQTDSEGNSYFPVNTWGFAVSPRNLKQYNYQMLLDSLVWNQYSVSNVSIDFIPLMGATQPGFFEAVLLNNAQIMPGTPYTNQSNSCNFSAVQQNFMKFSMNSESVVNKNMKSVSELFDSVADFGILWCRVGGFSNLTAITEVAKLTISISVNLSNYSPSPYAQLVGPWIEAGYPIESSEGQTAQTIVSVKGTEVLEVDASQKPVSVAKIAKGKAKLPRWRIQPDEGDPEVIPLGGPVFSQSHLRRLTAADSTEVKFPVLADGNFDGAVSGSCFLDDVADKANDLRSVSQPAGPYVADPELYLSGTPEVKRATPKGTEAKLQLAYQPTQTAANTTALAQGGVSVSFEGSTANAGKKVGATLRYATSFMPGSVPLTGDYSKAAYQPAAGYDNLGTFSAANPEGSNSWKALLGCIGIAGMKRWAGLKGAKAEEEISTDGVNSFSNTGSGNESKATWVKDSEDGTLEVQAAAIEVPANAAYCNIGSYPAGSTAGTYAESFLDFMPLAAKYGLVKLNPAELTNDKARIDISGQVNTLHTALVAVQGSASQGTTQLPYAGEVKDLLVMVASRTNPAVDPAGFYDTAIPVTSILDGVTTTNTSGSMYVNKSPESQGNLVIQSTITTNSGVRETANPVAGFGAVQVVSANPCNFTVPFPDYLWSADTNTLTAVKAGEKIYFSIVKSTAFTVYHTVNQTVGTFKLWVFPNLIEGTDKVTASQALHTYILTTGDTAYEVKSITEGDAKTSSVYLAEDGERRFTLEVTTPAAQSTASNKSIKCNQKG